MERGVGPARMAAGGQGREQVLLCIAGEEPRKGFEDVAAALRAAFRRPDGTDGGLRAAILVVPEPMADSGGTAGQRVLETLHPGQVVMTDRAHELAPDDGSLVYRSLGVHRLRDLGPAVELWQVAPPDATSSFPPLASLDRVPNNLPVHLSPFVGREDALRHVAAQVRRSRLITLVGPGGVGKTRLSNQVAARMAGRPFEEVWVVRLEDVGEPDRVAQTVAVAVQADATGEVAAIEQVVARLAGRRALLVLDNCEHVLGAALDVTSTVLARCPQTRVLATSRQPLELPGEAIWTLPGLSCVADPEASSAEDLRRNEAVQLFLQRAATADPQLDLRDDASVRSVARICRRLDGLPLGIELAAARTRHLTLSDIERGLDGHVDLAAGGRHRGPARHRSLRAAVTWSHDLLDEREQWLFDRLGVFNGAVEAGVVSAVCGIEPLDRDEVPALLAGLVDQSLVVADRRGPTTRFRQLETLRAFARHRLEEQGDDAAYAAHLDWIVRLAAEASEHLTGPDQQVWFERITGQLDDVIAAVVWALATERAADALGVVVALYRYWYVRDVRRGTDLLDRIRAHLDLGTLPDVDEARVRFVAGVLRVRRGQDEAAGDDLRRVVAIARDREDARFLAQALVSLARARWEHDPPEVLHTLLAEAAEVSARIDDVLGQAMSEMFLLLWSLTFGRPRDAVERGPRCRELLEATGSPQLAAHGAEMAALAATQDGRLDEARRDMGRALTTYRRLGSGACAAHGLLNAADVLASGGDDDAAMRLLGASTAIRERLDLPVPGYELGALRPLMEELQERLPAARRDRLEAEGTALSFEEAMALALTLLAADTRPVVSDVDTVYRILGPLAASVGAEEVELGPGKQRRVLARLLLSEGAPVSVDALTEAVWGTDPPAKPRASLQAYVSRLRRALGAEHAISAGPTGYAIDLDQADIDLHRAEAVVARVRDLSDPAEMAACSQQALQLWRGRPLADLEDLPATAPLRARADEARRRLVRARVAALLELDRPADAVAELAGALDAYPYDEPLHELHLRALTRCGRAGEALAAYDRLRRRLAEELGSEPGPSLRGLHLDLLDREAG